MLAGMARVTWAAAAIVTVLAPWYGQPAPLRFSAWVAVLAATLAVSVPRLARVPLGVVTAVASLCASGWAWQTLGRSFLDAAADSDKVLFWTTIEVAGLAALGARLARADRRSDRLGGWLLLLPGAAVAVRLLPDAPAVQQLFLAALGTAAVASGNLLGLQLRGLDQARVTAVEQARARQGRALAADLHDYVAHDIAGIAVLAQSIRIVSANDAAESIEHIERAAARALRQLDHSIQLLRDDAAPTRQQYGLADVPGLVAGYPVPAVLVATVDDTDDIPVAVQATAHRVIAESLTNVARHAPHARPVRVSVTRHDGHLDVVIINKLSTGAGPTGAAAGSGLENLGIRVAALGGNLRAGAERGQWRVVARLPIDGADVRAP